MAALTTLLAVGSGCADPNKLDVDTGKEVACAAELEELEVPEDVQVASLEFRVAIKDLDDLTIESDGTSFELADLPIHVYAYIGARREEERREASHCRLQLNMLEATGSTLGDSEPYGYWRQYDLNEVRTCRMAFDKNNGRFVGIDSDEQCE